MQQAAAQQAQAPAPGQQGQQPGPNYPMASLYVGDLAPEVIIITIVTSIILDINISLLLIIIISNIIIIVFLCMDHAPQSGGVPSFLIMLLPLSRGATSELHVRKSFATQFKTILIINIKGVLVTKIELNDCATNKEHL